VRNGRTTLLARGRSGKRWNAPGTWRPVPSFAALDPRGAGSTVARALVLPAHGERLDDETRSLQRAARPGALRSLGRNRAISARLPLRRSKSDPIVGSRHSCIHGCTCGPVRPQLTCLARQTRFSRQPRQVRGASIPAPALATAGHRASAARMLRLADEAFLAALANVHPD
jgi:hypothetical protein